MRTTRAATVALIPSAAYADTYTRYDSWKDVEYVTFNENPVPPPPVKVPERTLGDITQLRVDHRATVVHVAVYFRALARAGDANFYRIYLSTPTVKRDIEIKASPGHWAGVVHQSTVGTPASCPGLVARIEYSHQRVVVDVPRTCLGSPTSVKVGASTLFYAGGRRYIENAMTKYQAEEGTIFGPSVQQ